MAKPKTKPSLPSIQQVRAGQETRTPSRTFAPLAASARLITVPLDKVVPNPRNPRKKFDPDALQDLADSIAAVGILQPPIVKPQEADGTYVLIAGDRRTRAARIAGHTEVEVLIRKSEDDLTDAMIENLSRADLSPVEIARGYASLIDDLGITREELARRMGRKISRSTISNHIRLLELPDPVLENLDDGKLTFAHGLALLSVEDHDQRKRLARQAVDLGWSKRTLETAARELTERPTRKRVSRAERAAQAEAQDAADQLTEQLALAGHLAAVKVTKKNVTITLADLDAAKNLVEGLPKRR